MQIRKEGQNMFRTLFDGIVSARLDELSLMVRELLRSRQQRK